MEINNINSSNDSLKFNKILDEEKSSLKNRNKNDQSKIWETVDDYLNLGVNNSFFNSNLSKKELEQSLKIIAKLMQKGVVGYSYYEVDGRIEKHFLVPSIGDQRLSSAELLPAHYLDKYY